MKLSKFLWHNLLAMMAYILLGYMVFAFFAKFAVFPAPTWPPSSIALLLMLLDAKKYCLAVFLASLIVNLMFFATISVLPLIAIIMISFFNVLAPMIAGYYIKKYSSEMPPFNNLKDVTIFVLFGVLLYAFISAFGGILSLILSESIPFNLVMDLALKWLLAEASGVLFFAPVLIFWFFSRNIKYSKKLYIEGIIVTFTVLFLTIYIFSHKEISQEMPYLLIFFFIWLAVRLSSKEALTVLVLFSVIATIETMHNLGPFSLENTDVPLQALGLMVVSLTVTLMVVGALGNESRKMAEELQKVNEHLEKKVHLRTAELNDELLFEQLLVDTIPNPFYYKNKQGFIIKCNKAFLKLTNKTIKDVLGKKVEEIGFELKKQDGSEVLKNEKHFLEEMLLVLPSGDSMSVLMAETFFKAKSSENLSGIITTFTDVTKLKKLQAILKEQAVTDTLTGLFNRRGFMERAENEFKRAKRFKEQLGVFMLDIDKFKNINDTYGHNIGDVVLKTIKDVFQKNLREVDICGRLGGEEFAVVLPNIAVPNTEILKDIAERIRKYIEELSVSLPGGEQINYTISIGVAIILDTDKNIEQILQRADENLYEAKHTGRNKIVLK